jgi:hypothetical protein
MPSRIGTPAMVSMLLAEGADVEKRDVFDKTPLMVAVEAGDPEAVALLLQADANVHARTDHDSVMRSAHGRAVVRLLLRAGGDERELTASAHCWGIRTSRSWTCQASLTTITAAGVIHVTAPPIPNEWTLRSGRLW